MENGWEDNYDKSVAAIVRETLTIVESVIPIPAQQKAIRRLVRKSIYGITDNLRISLVNEFGRTDGSKPIGIAPKKEFQFPKGDTDGRV
tara:strand:- start:282 stop:548 length:267 start_codon:yes stop_codon:yes gene_type:complete